MNQQEKTFSINVFPCKCATSLITKRKRQKSFYKLQNNPNSLKTDPTENTFNKREREKKNLHYHRKKFQPKWRKNIKRSL